MTLGRIPLRTRLALLATVLTLAGIAVGLGIVNWWLYQLRVAAYDAESRLIAELVLDSAVVREDQTVNIPRVVESYLTDESGVSAAQAFVDGRLIWEGGVIDAPRPLDAQRLVEGVGAQSVDEWRVFTRRDEDAGIVVQVGRPLLGVREVLTPLADIGLPVSLALAILSGLLAWWMTGLALRPLRELTAAAEGFEARGFAPDAPDAAGVPILAGADEPARLARSFADLLDRLRAERAREHGFLEYASHELRTPISALRAGLEAAASGRLTPSREMLERLHRESLRLETFAQNLLALSRAESGSARLQEVDLGAIAADAYDRLQSLAQEKALEISLDAAPAPASGDPRLLAQAVDNLGANALRFTVRGGIRISSGVESGRPFLGLCDTGPGMEESAAEGLGLRVVRAVAAAHDARVDVLVEGGTCVKLSLPPRASA